MNRHPWARTVRKRLRRHDGGITLDRWGFEIRALGGIFVHKMLAPDPGLDLHDHPWSFASLIVRGGYTEERADIRVASNRATIAEAVQEPERGVPSHRRVGSLRVMRLDECHRITHLHGPVVWTVVVHGPYRRTWGFYIPYAWVEEHTYDETVRVERRDLWNEIG